MSISINTTNPPDNFKYIAQLSQLIDIELLRKFYAKFLDTTPPKRGQLWEKLNLPTDKINRIFSEVVKERNRNNKNEGFESTLDFYLELNKITKNDYEKFIKNVDPVIDFCNRNLSGSQDLPDWFYSPVNKYPCFICRLAEFPFASLDDVYKKMSKKYNVLSKYKDKIKISEIPTQYSQTRYSKETDTIEITINSSQNLRHKSMDLIHELGHAISYIRHFLKNDIPAALGKYKNEKEAYEIELEFTKSISEDLYKANFAPILSNLVRVLFEIEFYNNPNQPPNHLFAKTFNRCFKNANQKENSLYMLEERILYQPFRTLPHAVAEVNLISQVMLQHNK